MAKSQGKRAEKELLLLQKRLEEQAAKEAEEARLFQEFQRAGNIDFGLTEARRVGGCAFQPVQDPASYALGPLINSNHKEILKNCQMFYTDKAVAEKKCYATKDCVAISTGCVDGTGGLCSQSFNIRVR